MRVYAQVVGIATGDSSPAVLVVTDTARYLFNVGEGLQRFCMEHHVRLVKVDALFFTRVTTESMGGLPGMLLTLADMGKRTLGVHGPAGLCDYLYGLRHFMRRDDVTVAAVEAGGEPGDATDALAPLVLPDITVHGVRLRAPQAVPAALRDVEGLLASQYGGRDALAHALAGVAAVDAGGLEIAACAFNPLRVTRWPLLAGNAGGAHRDGDRPPPATAPPATLPGAMDPSRWVEEGLGSAANSQYAMCYVLETAPLPGKFYPERAARYGVKPGPAFGRLTKGDSVEVTVPRARAVELGFAVPPPAAAAGGSGGSGGAAAAAATADAADAADAAAAAAAAAADATSGGRKAAKGGKKDAAAVITDGVTITVTPAHVKDPDLPGQVMAIVDVPSAAFLPAFLRAPRLAALAAGAAARAAVVVFHFSPPDVVADAAYQRWMAACGAATNHVLCHPPHNDAPPPPASSPPPPPPPDAATESPLAALAHATWALTPQQPPLLFRAQTLQLVKMHVLDPTAFPLPHPLDVATARAAATLGVTAVPPGSSALVELLRRHLATGAAGTAAAAAAAAALAAAAAATAAPAAPAPTAAADIAAAAAAVAAQRDVILRDYAMAAALPGVRDATVVRAVPLLSHYLVPLARARAGVDVADVPPALTAWEPLAVMLTDADMAPHVADAVARAQRAPPAAAAAAASSAGDPVPAATEVVFTGTSSAIPSKYRNVSGMFVTLDATGAAVLLDGGEGTYGQLARKFGADGARRRLAGLAVIWISHMHADHHLGIMRLIKERAAAAPAAPPALVVGPTRLYLWLLEASRLDAYLLRTWRFVDAEHFVQLPAASLAADAVAGGSKRLREDISTRVGATAAAAAAAAALSGGGSSASTGAAPAARASPSAAAAAAAAGAADSAKRQRVGTSPAAHEALAAPSPMAPSRLPPRSPAAASLPAGTLAALPPAAIDRCMAHSDEATRHVIPLLPHDATHAPDASDASAADHLARPAFVVAAFRACGIMALRVVRVQHCFKAYGLQLVLQTPASPAPWSLVYSGDTRPCMELVQLASHVCMPSAAAIAAAASLAAAGAPPMSTILAAVHAAHGADVLIHEATFEDSAEGRANALAKRHSTAGEACAVADAVSCTRLLLTHFSARYPKLPVLPADAAAAITSADASPAAGRRLPRSVCIAYDLMSAHVRRVAAIGELLPALRVLFVEEEEDGEDDGIPAGAGT